MVASADRTKLFAHASLLQVAQVAEQSERTELALDEQTLPHVRACSPALVAPGSRECNLPRVGRGELVISETLPQRSLRVIEQAARARGRARRADAPRRRDRTWPARTRRT